tara:strand:+ start:548 stop:1072 length:525 start_codon:yes stop_codon:yes gene_type:complete
MLSRKLILIIAATVSVGAALFVFIIRQSQEPEANTDKDTAEAEANATQTLVHTKIRWDALQGLDVASGTAQESLKKAITRPVKIPGYVVPLEVSDRLVSEFLLVPTVGACVHVPPPPSNQMIFATVSGEGVPAQEKRAPVWLFGNMEITSQKTKWGAAGFTMRVHKIEPYKGGY